MVRQILSRTTHRLYTLPVVILMPHSSCNCRCVMCDIWKANHNTREITTEELDKHLDTFRSLRVKEFVLSGGEALLHQNLWRLCEKLKSLRAKVTLLTTGLLLERYADEINRHIDEVIISIDGTPEIHNRVRNVPGGFEKISRGVTALRKKRQSLRITARCVIQKRNFLAFIDIVRCAKTLGIDQISFLGADVSTSAFNRGDQPDVAANEIVPDKDDCRALEDVLRRSFTELADEYASRFIAENPGRIMRIAEYYKALNGLGPFPKVRCNAPWVSTVIESDGRVMPCFFHEPYGNLSEGSLHDLINGSKAVQWRKDLDVEQDAVCEKCVCSLNLPVIRRPF